MSDKNPPPSDETAPIAGQRPPAGSAPAGASPAPGASPASAPPADPPVAAYGSSADDPQGTPGKRSWRERLRRGTAAGGGRTFGVTALVAGTIAGLLVGGLGGVAIGAAFSDDDRRGDRIGHVERGYPGGSDDLRDHGGPGSGPGGPIPLPPTDAPGTTPPTEDEESAPESSGWSSS
jgi:hypothetical protein